jgi:group I intron endonuclease
MEKLNLFKNFIINSPNLSENDNIGYVYLFHNPVNDKIYIGKTIQNYKLRWNDHKCNAFTKNIKNHFYNSIRKYGWDNFDKYIIFQTEEIEDKLEIDKVIIEKEIYFINLFESNNSNFGYNHTIGGDGICGYKHTEESKQKMSIKRKGELHPNFGNFNNSTSHSVLQFDLNLNLVNSWPSMAEISRQLGYNDNNISRCCSGQLQTYMNFIWIKSCDFSEEKLESYRNRINEIKNNGSKYAVKSKKVLQYDFIGNFIKSWTSCAIAAKDFKCDGSLISGAASGKFTHGKNFIWIYEKDFTLDILKNKLECVKFSKNYSKVIEDIKQKLKTIRDYE